MEKALKTAISQIFSIQIQKHKNAENQSTKISYANEHNHNIHDGSLTLT